MLTLIIVVDGVRKTLSVPDGSTIKHIFDQVHKMVNLTDADTLYLAFEGRALEHDRGQTVTTYNIGNMSTITVAIRVHGGAGTFTDIPGQVTRTREACNVCYDDDEGQYRAKMRCGHIYCSGCMSDFCSAALNSGLYFFKCSFCPAEFQYAYIRHVACFSDNDMAQKGEQLNTNFLRFSKSTQQCPSCQNYCMRELDTWNGPKNFVDCPVCTNRRGKKTSFCWSCKGEWRGGLSGKLCGNAGCDGGDSRVGELAKCPTKELCGMRACPVMRGCGRCGALIIHRDNCKHITCHACQYNFCFACLCTPTSAGWQCGGAYTACPGGVAPRQTSLPA